MGQNIKLFIATGEVRGVKFYRRDCARLRRTPNLAHSRGFLLSRWLKWRYKLKDHICISHKSNFAVVAYSKSRIGIDVERLCERNFTAAMEFAFDEAEQRYVQNAQDKILAFYQIWTAKEAYIKYAGLGFDALKSVKFYEILNKMTTKFMIFDSYLVAVVCRKGR